MQHWFRRLDSLRRFLDGISEWAGRTVAWLTLGMVLLIVYDVGMRYLFRQGSVALQELEWHLFALLFLLGSAYTLKHDGHVRVDVLFHGRWSSPRIRAAIDIFGTLFFLLPFCLLIIYSSWPFVHNSFIFHEGSPDPGGLPGRFVLKGAIPTGFFLLSLQGIAGLLRNVLLLFAPRQDG